MIDIRSDHKAYRGLCVSSIGTDLATAPSAVKTLQVALDQMSIHEKMDWFHAVQIAYRDQTQEPRANHSFPCRGAWPELGAGRSR